MTALATLTAPAQELIYQEDFETDGEAANPQRYTTVGRDVYEVDRIRGELGKLQAAGTIPAGLDFKNVSLDPPKDPKHGDVATNAAMVNALTVEDYEALARRTLDAHKGADGLFLSARGNLLALTRRLEQTFGVPAIEQVRASVWWAVTRLGGSFPLRA